MLRPLRYILFDLHEAKICNLGQGKILLSQEYYNQFFSFCLTTLPVPRVFILFYKAFSNWKLYSLQSYYDC